MIFFPNYSICSFQLIIGSLNRAKNKDFIGKIKIIDLLKGTIAWIEA